MQDLNKIRDEAVKQVIQIIEDSETDPLTEDEKKKVATLIEDAMTGPARDPGMIDNLADYVLNELGTKEKRG